MSIESSTTFIRTVMPFCATLGVRSTLQTPDEVVLEMPWAPELCTAGGVLHGGAIMALADSAGAVCTMLNMPEGATGTATIESKTNFLGAVREGVVIATSTPLHRGGSTIVIETTVRDSAGKLIAKVTQTQIVLRYRS